MARTTPLWQQSGNYSAKADRALLAASWPTGAVRGGITTAVSNTMDVSIAPGMAAVPLQTGQGAALCSWDAPEVVTLDDAPPSGQTRTDLIICQVRDADYDGGANNDFVITAIPGTAAAMLEHVEQLGDAPPVRPDVKPDEPGRPSLRPVAPRAPAAPPTPANALALCAVTVPGAAANLNAATVADRRQPMPGTSARYWRAQDFTVIWTPGMQGSWFDNRSFDDFSGQGPADIQSGPAPADLYSFLDDMVHIPADGVWRFDFQSTINTNNSWAAALLYLNPTGGPGTGSRIGFMGESTPMNTWSPVLCHWQGRLHAGDVVANNIQASSGSGAGVPGMEMTWFAMSYIGP